MAWLFLILVLLAAAFGVLSAVTFLIFAAGVVVGVQVMLSK